MRRSVVLACAAGVLLASSAWAFPFTSAWWFSKAFSHHEFSSKAFPWCGLEGTVTGDTEISLLATGEFRGHIDGVEVAGLWKKASKKGRCRLALYKASRVALAEHYAQRQEDVLEFLGYGDVAVKAKPRRVRAFLDYTPGQSTALTVKMRFVGSVCGDGVWIPTKPVKNAISGYVWDVSDDAIDGS